MEREEIEEMVASAVRQAMEAHMAHPGKRAKVTKFTDPEGKTWMSATLDRGEVVRKVLTLVALVIASTVALIQFSNRWFLIPTMDARANGIVHEHELRVRQEMQQVVPDFVTKAEFDKRVAAADGRWETQKEFNERVAADLAIMQADIKEILKRLR